MFQSTPPHGGRRPSTSPRPEPKVSIHAPAWGATAIIIDSDDPAHVSIHAPAWGATAWCYDMIAFDDVSIHAPAWGATCRWRPTCCRHHCFNPRPRMGGDFHLHQVPFQGQVSIHAPAWGATNIVLTNILNKLFQSTPPHGGRQRPHFHVLLFVKFQSTPPHGGRLIILLVGSIGIWFQSTPPHGGRLSFHIFSIPLSVFQSTPPHGGRQASRSTVLMPISFNPRPRMGGD